MQPLQPLQPLQTLQPSSQETLELQAASQAGARLLPFARLLRSAQRTVTHTETCVQCADQL